MYVRLKSGDFYGETKQGEVYMAKRYHLDPWCKVVLMGRVPDGYNPMSTAYMDDVEILSGLDPELLKMLGG